MALCLAAILGMCLAANAVDTAGDAARPQRALVYAQWDEDFLYLASRVEDTNLAGVNNTAMSEPWRDDSVEFYLDMSGPAGDAVNPACARFSISVASGFAGLVGTEAGTWRAQPEWLMGLKLAVEREGTLNKPEDRDAGYVVEIGIPWRFLGGTPQPGRRIGFNFVVSIRGEGDACVGWASRAKSPDSFDRPAAWGSLVISGNLKPSVAENDMLVCPRTLSGPTVDGKLEASEWLGASVAQLDLPKAPALPRPAVGRRQDTRLIATYRYDYQALPAGGDARPLPVFADQPTDGLGPWFSVASVKWHKAMLRQAREGAIDTIAPIYRCDAAARHDWARLGLLALAEALKQAKEERFSYPLVAMYLDASSLPEAGAADLTTAAGKQALWAAVDEFYSIVPDEFRAQFDLGAGKRSSLLILGPPAGLTACDGATIDSLRAEYRRAYGLGLVVLGDDGWRALAPNLDGYCSFDPAVAFSYGKDGPRTVVRLCPGYLAGNVILPRHGGHTYEQNWSRAASLSPDFIIIDSFNDFARGSEIAASREHGVRYLDLTRAAAAALADRRPYRVALRRETLPPVLQPGVKYQIELLFDNYSFEDIAEKRNCEMTYTIQSRSRADVKRTAAATNKLVLLAGQRGPLVADISTTRMEGPLPSGDYSLDLRISESPVPILRTKWLSNELFSISLPVKLERAPADRATVLGSTMPAVMAAGARRRVRLRLRNDGSRTWPASRVALSYHWLRVPAPTAAAIAPEVVEWEGVRTALPRSVAPGEMITMYAWIEAKKADGEPLAGWTPDQDWLYQLRWDLVEGKDRWLSRAGDAVHAETVAVLAADPSGAVLDADTPKTMQAGKSYPVKVVVRNSGAAAWDRDRVRVTYRWHYWDGAEAAASTGAAARATEASLSASVLPGESAMVAAQVTAPDAAGPYRLSWHLVADGHLASERLGPDSRSMLVQSVGVTGGPYQPLDLTKLVNVLAATHDGYRARGAFDAAGFSLPAEFIPPDVTATQAAVQGAPALYPGAYYSARANPPSGASPARVPLRYPPNDQRGAAAVACAGQQIALPTEPLRAIYIAAASSEALDAAFAVTYADGANDSKVLRVPSWVAPPPEATVALQTPLVRGTQDDLARPAGIYLLCISDLADAKPATALVLPSAPQIKIFAITIEKQGVASKE
jgi:hypothetical protein